jgi:TetR/AcrR family transcriptional regulator
MNYIAERREEEKERRRVEIVDAAEQLYAEKGWEAVTMDQVAKTARLSRALLYVYFRDKDELLYAIGERAMRMLGDRFAEAASRHPRGLEQVEAIGRAYMAYAVEFPHYFDFCMRFQAHSLTPDPGSTEDRCALKGDEAIGAVVKAIHTGIADGSIRKDVGDPMHLAIALWGFTHGATQLATAKGKELEFHGVVVPQFTDYVFRFLRESMASRGTG